MNPVVDARGSKINPGIFALTRRERQVLRLVVNGLKNREMAAALGLSIRTVESHRWRLMLKLDARNAKTLKKIVTDAEREGVLDLALPEWRA